jgi:hypothetical protein
MRVNLAQKRIIIIHGLASKPPEDVWLKLCRSCLVENIGLQEKALASQLEKHPETIQSAYWADCVPHHIPDDDNYCSLLQERVCDIIAERKEVGSAFHVGVGERVGAFFKNRGADLVEILASAVASKEAVMKSFLEETRLYSEEQYIADLMRRSLEEHLMESWKQNCDVALLSHSMGTFIAFDVLWRFSHRAAEPYRSFHNRKVQLFVTMGSPLCEAPVKAMLFARHHSGAGSRQFPTNFQMWHNYSCLGDLVCHGADFRADYFNRLCACNVIASEPEHLLIDYSNLHNPFVNVEHEGNLLMPKRNPHKEYGYYVQPRLGTWLADFLTGRLLFT